MTGRCSRLAVLAALLAAPAIAQTQPDPLHLVGGAAAGGGGGPGTVTNVGLAAPADLFSVAGSPVTTTGTLTLTKATAAANTCYAGPVSGGAAAPAFRALVAADIPPLPYAGSASAAGPASSALSVTGFTALRCARFDGGGVLVVASDDCLAGDTGVTGLATANAGDAIGDNEGIRGDGTIGIQGSAYTVSDTNAFASTVADTGFSFTPLGTGDFTIAAGAQLGLGTATPAAGVTAHVLATAPNMRMEASSGAAVLDLRRTTSGDSNVVGFYTGGTRNFYLAHLSDGTMRWTRDSTGDDVTLTPDGWLVPKLGKCRVAADQTNATTTFASTTCTISGLVAARKYPFRCWFSLNQSTAADGVKFDFAGGTATETAFRASATIYDAALALVAHPDDLTDVVAVTTLTGLAHAEVFGDFVPSGNGTFLPRFAENGSTAGDLTLHAGSWCTVEDSP